MPIEAFGNIDDLDPLNPLVDDPVSEGDDHLRGLKLSLQGNVQGDDVFTALLVGGFISALVDALAFTVKGAPAIDLDRSSETEQTIIRMRNAAGGWQLNTFVGSGDMLFQETDAAGVAGNVAWQCLKSNAFQAQFDGVLGIGTRDRTLDNSGGSLFDAGGVERPAGYNVLPRNDASTRSIVPADSGTKLRPNGGAQLTFPATLPDDFTCVIIQAIGTCTLLGTMRLYTGNGFLDGNITLLAGSVATVSKTGNVDLFETWGNGASVP